MESPLEVRKYPFWGELKRLEIYNEARCTL